jgi:5-methylcytosine-specific restriction protein B
MVRTSEKARIYEIADKFRSQCLTESRSLLWPDHRIWTVENLTAFRDAFIKHPDEGDRTFSQKLHDQLSGASEDIHRLAADILAIYQLFPSDWTVTSKISNIETIVGWKLAEDQPVYASIRSAYEAKGIGGTGQWYAQGRPWHIAYYIDFSIHAISGRLDPADENSSRLGADFLADRQPNVNLSRNILLHLMFPDEYEKIASQRQKRQITKVFSQFKGDTDIVDHQIANIRGELAKEHGPGFDFLLSISKCGTDQDPRELSLWRASAEFPDGPVVASAPIDRL